jgi:hypothetical protein
VETLGSESQSSQITQWIPVPFHRRPKLKLKEGKGLSQGHPAHAKVEILRTGSSYIQL